MSIGFMQVIDFFTIFRAKKTAPPNTGSAEIMICSFLPYKILSKKVGNKYLEADDHKYDSAEDGCLACDAVAEALADVSSEEAETKGYKTDDDNRNESLDEGMCRNGEAHRESINRGGNALQENGFYGQLLACAFLAIVMLTFVDHLCSDEGEKSQSDPWNENRKSAKELKNSMYADPSDKRHKPLTNTECSRDHKALFSGHTGLCETVCQGDRKCVCRKTDAEKYAVKEEKETEIHIVTSVIYSFVVLSKTWILTSLIYIFRDFSFKFCKPTFQGF
jgi:hypothetical protein